MAKLTQTQALLLARAKGNERGLVHTQQWLATSHRRPEVQGTREGTAARKLVTLGYLEHVKSSSDVVYGGAGNTTHVWEQVWRITPSGKALEAP